MISIGSTPASRTDLDQFAPDIVDDIRTLSAQEVQARQDGGIGFRLELGERQRLKFGLDRIHADALGERGVDLHRLAGDALAPLRVADEMQGAHVVQAVREFHQQHADVPAHGQDEFAEVLRLFGAVRLQFEPGQLGHAVDQAGDFLAEAGFDFLEFGGRVLDHVVQQRGGDRRYIQPVVGKDAGDGDGVAEIGVAVFPALGAVGFLGQIIGRIDQAGVGSWIVAMDFSRQIALAG